MPPELKSPQKQKPTPPRSAPPHTKMKTRDCLKYPVNDCPPENTPRPQLASDPLKFDLLDNFRNPKAFDTAFT